MENPADLEQADIYADGMVNDLESYALVRDAYVAGMHAARAEFVEQVREASRLVSNPPHVHEWRHDPLMGGWVCSGCSEVKPTEPHKHEWRGDWITGLTLCKTCGEVKP